MNRIVNQANIHVSINKENKSVLNEDEGVSKTDVANKPYILNLKEKRKIEIDSEVLMTSI